VITDLTVMETNRQTGRLRILKLMPGVSVDTVMAETGFDPEVADQIESVVTPSDKELSILREEVDPYRHYIKVGV
jgi:acyl CoA:acetate/3-ketoacid CoA transferase beta subunit